MKTYKNRKRIFNYSFNYEFYLEGILSARVFVAAMDLPNGYDLVYLENRGAGRIPDEIMVKLANRLKRMLDLDTFILWVEKYQVPGTNEFKYYLLNFQYGNIELTYYKNLYMRMSECPDWMVDYIMEAIANPVKTLSPSLEELDRAIRH